MKVDDKIKYGKIQYDINREAGKTSVLSSDKNDKDEYLTGENILQSDEIRIIKQTTFIYSPLGKAFEKRKKIIEEQGKNKLKVLRPITQKLIIKEAIPENTLTEEAKIELNKIKEIEKMVDRENLYYKKNKYTYNFQSFRTTSSFGRDIYNGAITKKETDGDQSYLLVENLNFRKQVKPKNIEKNNKKKMFLKTYIIFLKVEKNFSMLLIVKYFQ